MDTILSYTDYLDNVCEAVAAFYSDTAEVSLKKVTKNNGVVLDGLSILEKGSDIAPAIYLNQTYDDYKKSRNIDLVVKNVICAYENSRHKADITERQVFDFESCKGCLGIRLINYDKNQELLSQTPHRRFLDLAAVFMCVLKESSYGNASMLINHRHLSMWGISESELVSEAFHNAPLFLPSCLHNIGEFLPQGLPDSGKIVMKVLTNRINLYGASAILYDKELDRLSEILGGDMLIIPSSVHELIVVPFDMGLSRGRIRSLVREVNSTVVSREEFLSDNIYRYDKNRREMAILL